LKTPQTRSLSLARSSHPSDAQGTQFQKVWFFPSAHGARGLQPTGRLVTELSISSARGRCEQDSFRTQDKMADGLWAAQESAASARTTTPMLLLTGDDKETGMSTSAACDELASSPLAQPAAAAESPSPSSPVAPWTPQQVQQVQVKPATQPSPSPSSPVAPWTPQQVQQVQVKPATQQAARVNVDEPAAAAEPPVPSPPQPATQPQHGADGSAGAEAALAQAARRTAQRARRARRARREEEQHAIDVDAAARAAADAAAAAAARRERVAVMRVRSAELRAEQAAGVEQGLPARRAENREMRALFEAQAAFLMRGPQLPIEVVRLLVEYDRQLSDAMVELSARVIEHGMPVYDVVKRVAGHEGTNALLTARGEEAAAHSARDQRHLLRTMADYDRAIGAGNTPGPLAHHTAAGVERGILPSQGGISGSLDSMSRVSVAKALAGYYMPLHRSSAYGRLPEPCALKRWSVFADAGQGSGGVIRALASLVQIELVVGFDISLSHLVSSDNLTAVAERKLRDKGLAYRTRLATGRWNAAQGRGYEPITHLYSYIGSRELALAVCRTIATSTTLRAALLVCTHVDLLRYILDAEFLVERDRLDGFGFVPRQPWQAAMRLCGFKCEQGTAYPTFLIAVSAELQEHVRQLMARDEHLEPIAEATSTFADALATDHFTRFG
jgi:hypothetical protein